tara:strand:+ start:519 stop:680 length:162 start_codon:yes stop_codon:yes gene_type:complete
LVSTLLEDDIDEDETEDELDDDKDETEDDSELLELLSLNGLVPEFMGVILAQV